MGNNLSFTPATVRINKKEMLPTFFEINYPFSRMELFNFSEKHKYDVIKALTNKGYKEKEAKLTVDHIDKCIEALKYRYELQEDISYVEFVSNRFEILLRISFWDLEKDEERKKATHTNILKINIPYPN